MIQIKGKKFYKEKEEILFKGIGIGTWLNMEHFMVGLPGCDFQIRTTLDKVFGVGAQKRFYDRFVKEFVSEEDFCFLKELGINLVRVPFNYRLFLDDANPRTWREEGFRYFDYLLDLCEKYEIYALPDLHAVPGGQNPDWHSDNGTGHTLFWQYEIFQEQVAQLWRAIAERYKDREYLLGYDILNEPFIIPDYLDTSGEKDPATGMTASKQDEKLVRFYEQVTKAIRSVDKKHIIFLEGDHFASDFTCLEGKIIDEQTALTFHFYPTVWYEDLFEPDYDPGLRFEKFEEVFRGLIQIRETFDRPILCGEAGYDIVNNGLELCMELVKITFELFRKYQVSFTLWCYKDAAFMGMVYPKKDSLWMKLAAEIHEKWNHYEEMKMADTALCSLLDEKYPLVTEDEKYMLSFRIRAVLYPVEQQYILKPLLEKMEEETVVSLTESFAFAECDYYKEYAKQYKDFCFQPEEGEN